MHNKSHQNEIRVLLWQKKSAEGGHRCREMSGSCTRALREEALRPRLILENFKGRSRVEKKNPEQSEKKKYAKQERKKEKDEEEKEDNF
ncbi:hypothetical protein RUM44_002446 [Polyplax serrata]|uniref:Uncharacterized protein n=1 Tax=Polyplax serrata TaxID=468196 RepID=A0ABR1AET4_POLSC